MRITKTSNYQDLLDNNEIMINKISNHEFILYTPLGTTRKTRKDIGCWFFKKENKLPPIWDLDYSYGNGKAWINGRNWLDTDFKFE